MGETPTLLTCGICGGESRPIHHLTDCIDVLRARADAAEAALAKFRMVNPARADLIEALAAANARAEKAEEWRHAGNALVTQLRADLAAARLECDVMREALRALLAFPGSNASDHEQCDEKCPYERARAALAAPADGEDGKR